MRVYSRLLKPLAYSSGKAKNHAVPTLEFTNELYAAWVLATTETDVAKLWHFSSCNRCQEQTDIDRKSQNRQSPRDNNIGASTIRIGFGGPLDYKYNKEPSK